MAHHRAIYAAAHFRSDEQPHLVTSLYYNLVNASQLLGDLETGELDRAKKPVLSTKTQRHEEH